MKKHGFLALVLLICSWVLAPRTHAAPAPKKAPDSITWWVFDLDDNIVSLPTKIYLLGVGPEAGNELPVSTEKFAQIAAQVGKAPGSGEGHNPYQHYKIDTQDRIHGSMRDFNDLADPKKFETDFMAALENLEKNKGPSWDAMLAALNDPKSAKNTSVITARGHGPDTLQLFFKELKKRGYIKYIPPVENIHTVDNPHFQMATPDESIASRKARVFHTILDRAAEERAPPSSPLIHNPDGTGKSRFVKVGFSDDSEENIHKMQSYISQRMKETPSLWKNLKISLFYAAPNKAKRQAYVAKSNGDWRKYLNDEYVESATTKFDKHASQGYTKGTKVKSSVTTESPIATAEDSILKIHYNRPITQVSPKVVYTPDLTGEDLDQVLKFIRNKSIPNVKKRVVINRYTVADERVLQVALEAKKNGIPFTLITDLNTSMDISPDHSMIKRTTNMKLAKFQDNENGRFMKKFIDAGFPLGGKDWGIVSQPLFNKKGFYDEERPPLMHEKTTLCYTVDAEGQLEKVHYDAHLTANATNGPRINSLTQNADPDLGRTSVEHVEDQIKTFRAGGTIKDLSSTQVHRSVYKDGTFRERAYTNGTYNPNQRIADELADSVKNSATKKLKNVQAAEFVITHGQTVNELQNALKQHPEAKAHLFLDDKQTGTHTYGLSATTQGSVVKRDIPGKAAVVPAWGEDISPRVSMDVLVKGVPGLVETKLDDVPNARELMHLKQIILEFLVKNPDTNTEEVITQIFNGSLNLSNNFQNAEVQEWMSVKGDSHIAKGMKQAIEDIIKEEQAHIFSGQKSILLSSIAHLMGRSTLEISRASVDEVWEARQKNDLVALSAALKKIFQQPTSITDGPAPEQVKANVKKLLRLLQSKDRYEQSKSLNAAARAAQKPPLSHTQFIEAMDAASDKGESWLHLNTALESLFWEQGRERSQLREVVDRAKAELKAMNYSPPANPAQARAPGMRGVKEAVAEFKIRQGAHWIDMKKEFAGCLKRMKDLLVGGHYNKAPNN